MKRCLLKAFGVLLSVAFVCICLNINYVALIEMPNNIHITLDDLNDFNALNSFGSLVNVELNENIMSVGGKEKHNTSLYLKLFGFLPIKKVDVVVEDNEELYLGGIPLGFSI